MYCNVSDEKAGREVCDNESRNVRYRVCGQSVDYYFSSVDRAFFYLGKYQTVCRRFYREHRDFEREICKNERDDAYVRIDRIEREVEQSLSDYVHADNGERAMPCAEPEKKGDRKLYDDRDEYAHDERYCFRRVVRGFFDDDRRDVERVAVVQDRGIIAVERESRHRFGHDERRGFGKVQRDLEIGRRIIAPNKLGVGNEIEVVLQIIISVDVLVLGERPPNLAVGRVGYMPVIIRRVLVAVPSSGGTGRRIFGQQRAVTRRALGQSRKSHVHRRFRPRVGAGGGRDT